MHIVLSSGIKYGRAGKLTKNISSKIPPTKRALKFSGKKA